MRSGSKPIMERLRSEATFHDHAFAEHSRSQAGKFYAVAMTSQQRYREQILRNVAGIDVLEYGCGRGSMAFDLARAGGNVVGIDISQVGIDLARQRASGERVMARFERMDAERLAFPDASFDRVVGSGILHHLDLDRAFAEVRRVLRPDGRAVFYEPLGHNPAINWYRRRTPHLRTPLEHPLLLRDLEAARRYFALVEPSFYHLTSLALVPLRATPLFRPLYATFEAFDRLLFRTALRRWAWCAIIELAGSDTVAGRGSARYSA